MFHIQENNKLLILSMKISLSWTLFSLWLAQVYSWNQTADKLVILLQTKKFQINCSKRKEEKKIAEGRY